MTALVVTQPEMAALRDAGRIGEASLVDLDGRRWWVAVAPSQLPCREFRPCREAGWAPELWCARCREAGPVVVLAPFDPHGEIAQALADNGVEVATP